MGDTVELWVEYGIGIGVFMLRFFARFKLVGLGGFTWDDLFSLIALVLWTVDATTVQIISNYGSFVGLNEQTAAALTDTEAARLEVGSKALFIAWISYVTLIWSLKASLLCFYSRLTLGLWQQKFVKVMSITCVFAYIAVIFTLFIHCTPIQKNWQIRPYAGDKCTITVANYIVVAALNVVTDMGILAIPVPLIWAVKIPLRRKIVIALLLSSGIFVITAAILRCVLTLASVTQIGNSTKWGIRETFVSVIAVSAPAIKPLFNKNRWIGSSHEKGASTSNGTKGGISAFGRNRHVREIERSITVSRKNKCTSDLEAGNTWEVMNSVSSEVELKDISRTGSGEHIMGRHSKEEPHLEINMTTAYALANEKIPDRAEDIETTRDRSLPSPSFWGGASAGTLTQVSVGNPKSSQGRGPKSTKILGIGTSS